MGGPTRTRQRATAMRGGEEVLVILGKDATGRPAVYLTRSGQTVAALSPEGARVLGQAMIRASTPAVAHCADCKLCGACLARLYLPAGEGSS